MHAFVFGLLQQRADPALVVAHATQALQVHDRRADHAGHRGHGLEDDRAVTIALDEKRVGTAAKEPGEAQRDAVGHAGGR